MKLSIQSACSTQRAAPSAPKPRAAQRQTNSISLLAAVAVLATGPLHASALGLESFPSPFTLPETPDIVKEARENQTKKLAEAEAEFQNSPFLQKLKQRSDENKDQRRKELEARYCSRQAELGVGDCAGLRLIPGATQSGVQKVPEWLEKFTGPVEEYKGDFDISAELKKMSAKPGKQQKQASPANTQQLSGHPLLRCTSRRTEDGETSAGPASLVSPSARQLHRGSWAGGPDVSFPQIITSLHKAIESSRAPDILGGQPRPYLARAGTLPHMYAHHSGLGLSRPSLNVDRDRTPPHSTALESREARDRMLRTEHRLSKGSGQGHPSLGPFGESPSGSSMAFAAKSSGSLASRSLPKHRTSSNTGNEPLATAMSVPGRRSLGMVQENEVIQDCEGATGPKAVNPASLVTPPRPAPSVLVSSSGTSSVLLSRQGRSGPAMDRGDQMVRDRQGGRQSAPAGGQEWPKRGHRPDASPQGAESLEAQDGRRSDGKSGTAGPRVYGPGAKRSMRTFLCGCFGRVAPLEPSESQ